MRIVRTRSIPNVDDERLVESLAQLHHSGHTVEGLRAFDAPRRQLVEMGIKARLIRKELGIRGVTVPPCPHCDG